jgi:hypothetical protein
MIDWFSRLVFHSSWYFEHVPPKMRTYFREFPKEISQISIPSWLLPYLRPWLTIKGHNLIPFMFEEVTFFEMNDKMRIIFDTFTGKL